MDPWKREPAARLGRIDVFQKEDLGIRGLLFGLAAQTARPGFERLGAVMIAGACNNIGARAKSSERREEQKGSHLI